jgi:hypothetical protein
MGYNPETGTYTPDKPTSKLSGVGQYQTVDPSFKRSAAAEADAIKSLGMTKAEIDARGGVSASGYYGDSWNAQKNLTDAEYRAAIAGKTGVAQGEAINAATQKKISKLPGAVKGNDGFFYASEFEARQAGALGKAGGVGGASGSSGLGTPEQQAARQSAFDLLKLQFDDYGLGALVEPLRGLIQEGVSPSEFAVRLRQTDPYKKRFAANAARVSSGLRALSEGEYIRLEDDYQNVMRNYGLPASYYTKGEMGRQEGFEKLIAGDVSMTELEDRIMTAQNRVINAAPEVMTALKQFYPDIKNGEILAYTLDPTQGLADIKKKVLAAEIGGAAIGAGLGAAATRAEELARYGVTAESARQGYDAIGGGLERGRQLSSIYQQPDYNQAVAEQEIFNLPGQTQAGEKRKKIIGLEKATFGGQTGVSSGALSQNRAGSY